MTFSQGDLVSGQDDQGRSVVGVASTSGIGGWVIVTPTPRYEAGVEIRAPAIQVRASSCVMIEAAETRLASQQLRDRQHGGELATWQREAERRAARAREIDAELAGRALEAGRER